MNIFRATFLIAAVAIAVSIAHPQAEEDSSDELVALPDNIVPEKTPNYPAETPAENSSLRKTAKAPLAALAETKVGKNCKCTCHMPQGVARGRKSAKALAVKLAECGMSAKEKQRKQCFQKLVVHLKAQSCENNKAGGSTCGRRIEWVKKHVTNNDAAAAMNKIAQEFPAECGSCKIGATEAPLVALTETEVGKICKCTCTVTRRRRVKSRRRSHRRAHNKNNKKKSSEIEKKKEKISEKIKKTKRIINKNKDKENKRIKCRNMIRKCYRDCKKKEKKRCEHYGRNKPRKCRRMRWRCREVHCSKRSLVSRAAMSGKLYTCGDYH